MSGCHGIPRGFVILWIEERSKEKRWRVDGERQLDRALKKMKSSTHLIVGLTPCDPSTAMVVSAIVLECCLLLTNPQWIHAGHKPVLSKICTGTSCGQE